MHPSGAGGFTLGGDVCLAGLWCGNVIPGANTGLLTSEGCSSLKEETHTLMMVLICELTAEGASVAHRHIANDSWRAETYEKKVKLHFYW